MISSIAISIGKKHFEQIFRLKRCRFSSLQQKPDGPKVPKVSMNFGWSRYYNSIFSEFSGSICCIKISIDFFLELSQINRFKISGIFLLHQKPSCTKVPKNDFHTELTESSNLLFCVGTRLVSPINVSVESSINVEKGSFEKFLVWFLYQVFGVRKRTEGCVLDHLGFQNHVSTLVEAWFLPSRSQSERNNLSRRLGWKDVDFLPCNRNLLVRKFQKVQGALIYLDVLTQFSRNFQVQFVASRFQSTFFWSCHKSIDLKLVGFFCCIRNLVVPKFQKMIFILSWLNLQTCYSA